MPRSDRPEGSAANEPQSPAFPGVAGTDVIVLGRYRLTQRLGEGAGGETWRAEPVDGGEPVAIKIVSHAGMRSRGTSDLLREAAVLQGMRHPHIVRYLGVVDLPGSTSTFLIMEYVPGGNLADWIERRPPCSPRESAALVLQVADALAFLHGAGILHRDLKPANILVRPMTDALPVLLVADFGISRPLVGGLAPQTRPAGTPGYSPPETWRGHEVTTAADVFSLGALSWHLLTGSYPMPMPLRGAPDPVHLHDLLRSRAGVHGTAIAEATIRMLSEDPKLRPTLDEVRLALAPPPPPDVLAGTLSDDVLDFQISEGGPAPGAEPLEEASAAPQTASASLSTPTLVAAVAPSAERVGTRRGPTTTPPDGWQPVAPRTPARGRLLAALGLLAMGALVCAGVSRLRDDVAPTGSLPLASPVVVPVTPSPPETEVSPEAPPATDAVSAGAGIASPSPVAPSLAAAPEATAQRVAIERVEAAAVAAASGPIEQLRVGLRSPVGLPPDVEFVVTTAGGVAYRTPNTQATLTDVRAGRATFELRTTTQALASTALDLPPGDNVRVLCEALAADFSVLRCHLP